MPNKKYVGKHRSKLEETQTKKRNSTKAKSKASKKATTSKKKPTKKPATKQLAKKTTPKTAKSVKQAESFLELFIEKSKRYSKQIAVTVLVLLVGVTSIYGYGAYKEAQVENYKTAVYEINVSTEETVANANNVYANFIDMVIADEITKDFKQAADSTKRALLAIETLKPPPKYKSHYTRISAFYRQATNTYVKLDKICSYLATRNKQLTNIKKTGTYAEQIKGLRKKAALELSSEVQAKIHKAIKDMKRLAKKRLYEDKKLTSFIKALSEKTEELDKAINNRSRYQVKKALEDIAQDFSQNWENAFYAADRKALAQYDRKIQALRKLYKQTQLN